jgi:hypothetical protein
MESLDEKVNNGHAHIKGWGIDADRDNEPTYPIKHYTGEDHLRLNYTPPPPQPVNMEILRSNERPRMTAVFGTSSPPSGLSGKLRRYAFQFSEGSWGHWLPLILADRVNTIEGLIDDFKRGYIPNFFKERGWTAEWKYNKKNVIKNVAIGVAVTTAVVALLVWRNKGKKMEYA